MTEFNISEAEICNCHSVGSDFVIINLGVRHVSKIHIIGQGTNCIDGWSGECIGNNIVLAGYMSDIR